MEGLESGVEPCRPARGVRPSPAAKRVSIRRSPRATCRDLPEDGVGVLDQAQVDRPHAQQGASRERVERELDTRLLGWLVDEGRARGQATDERLVRPARPSPPEETEEA